MCQIAFIILGIIGLCGGISVKGLSIGILITVGIQMLSMWVYQAAEKLS